MSADSREIPEHPRPGEPLRDGIGEEDNDIPAWWWWSFIATILFAAFYVPYYTLSGWSQEGMYAAQVARAEAQMAAVRASLPTANPFRGDEAAIAEGKQIFDTICAACHKPDGSGLVGPSLVDPYWKYGSDDVALFESVAVGRPAGMPGWEAQLGSEKIWKVLAFMETLPRQEGSGSAVPTSGAEPSGTGTGSP
jgi:cytochrome c oxidase cbb3-type subunit III